VQRRAALSAARPPPSGAAGQLAVPPIRAVYVWAANALHCAATHYRPRGDYKSPLGGTVRRHTLPLTLWRRVLTAARELWRHLRGGIYMPPRIAATSGGSGRTFRSYGAGKPCLLFTYVKSIFHYVEDVPPTVEPGEADCSIL